MTATSRARAGALVTVVGAVGVVFGDIGTSTLYAMAAVLSSADPQDARLPVSLVYGMTSTVIWSMALIVTVLYVRLLLRADNDGEGGLLALLGLLRRTIRSRRGLAVLTAMSMFGAAMFLGDSAITPAISVLSAAEGLELVNPSFSHAVVPLAVVVLVSLFVIQRYGTSRIGFLFGPIMVVWFATIAVLGAVAIVREPAVLQALSPHWIVVYFRDEPRIAFLSLGAVVLAVTGAEALYADLAHFGRQAIARAWAFVVFPALVLSYLGQAAAVVHAPSAYANPFFAVVPSWGKLPMVVLATLATIIASQAVISGAFSVIHQASRLGFLPPLRIVHTSSREAGQIYVPAVNWTLAVAVLVIVLTFKSSASLASAYGVAVTSTITVTTILYLVLTYRRHGRVTPAFATGAVILLVVLVFVAANVPKIRTGGWLPLGVGAVLILVMATWRAGRRRVERARAAYEVSVADLVAELAESDVHRSHGTAVFLARQPDVAPLAMCTMVRQARVLPERAVLLSWSWEDVPYVARDERLVVDPLGDTRDGVVEVVARFGYRDHIDLVELLAQAVEPAGEDLVDLDGDECTYLVSVPVVEYSTDSSMAWWRQRLFLAINRLASDPVDRLSLPRDRTIVIGREVTL